MNILSSLSHASFVVQLIIFMLVCMSVFTWGVIAWKSKLLHKESRILSAVVQNIDDGVRISELRASLGKGQAEKAINNTISLASKRIVKCKKLSDISDVERIVKESGNSSLLSYQTNLERCNSSLATIANVSPYIGLVGTVWGLLDAFQNIGNVKVVTFQTVAPSIVEALFATAIGLAVAIPASAGYNIISKRTTQITDKLLMINDSLINQLSSYQADILLGESNRG